MLFLRFLEVIAMKKLFYIFAVFFALSFISCKGEVEQEIQETQLEKDKSGEEKESEKEKPLVGTVKDVSATIDVKSVSLFWTNPIDKDYSVTYITFTPEEKNVTQPIVVQGKPGEESSTIINGLQTGIEYTFSFIVLDKNFNKSESVTIKATPGLPPDVTPPAEIKNIKTMIADKTVMLSWINPDDRDFSNVQIIFTPKEEDVSQPIVIKGEPGKVSSEKISGLKNDTEYTFTIVTVDNDLNKSKGVIVKATPVYTEDTIPPEEVSDFTIKEGHQRVILNWTNPKDYDFYAVEITTTYIQDGVSKKTIVTGSSSEEKSCIISNLSNGREYSFAIVAIDSNNNRSQGITKNGTPRESRITIKASLPNDDGQNVILTNDKAPIKLDIWSKDDVVKVVYKKRSDDVRPNAESLLADENVTLVTLNSDPITFDVNENGIYDIVVQNEEICESTYVEVKTIDKTPLVEVSNLSVSCDGEYVNLVWKESYYTDKYNSPLKSIKITYVFNDDKDNGELNVAPGVENASIKIPDDKDESDIVHITVQAIDEVGNINQGCDSFNIIVTADNVEEKIKRMTESGRIWVIGEIKDNLNSITRALSYLKKNRPKIQVMLDLSKTYGLTCIEDSTFSYCTVLKSIKIPDSVKSIGDYAFKDCGLTSINIPNSVTRIGDYAFSGCSGLTSISIPDGLTSIGECAFEECEGLTSITMPFGLTSIGERAFYICTGLTSITMPDSMTSLGDAAFGFCLSLKSINIPDGITIIGENTFVNCLSLESINIPDSVTIIGKNAFYDCQSLKSINLPNGITIIGESCFVGCGELENIIIPDSVTSIKFAFGGCKGLTSIVIPNGITNISGTFSGCTGLTSIEIPEGVTDISWAFSGCTRLTSIEIPEGVTDMVCAFQDCTSLTSITIPNSVISIEGAFSGCTGLTSITIPNSVKYIGRTFFDCPNLTSIVFNDTESNWYITSDFSYEGGIIVGPMSATAPEANAKLLREYSDYYFYKNSD